MKKTVKQKTPKRLRENVDLLIENITDLELEIAKHSFHESIADRKTMAGWVVKLSAIASNLDSEIR
jgi:hypothetical protein